MLNHVDTDSQKKLGNFSTSIMGEFLRIYQRLIDNSSCSLILQNH